jgi:putative tributyrin esterase
MAIFECRFKSPCLRTSTVVRVVLPESAPPPRGYASLLLLHGLGDDYASWTRHTNLERYAERAGLAVIMPDVGRSYCLDMVHGLPYFRFLADELPATMARYFRLSIERDDRSVGGVSMGAYGALRLGLLRPDEYANVIAISAVADFRTGLELIRSGGMDFIMSPSEALGVVGAEFRVHADMDLFEILKRGAGSRLPRVYQACGANDFLYADNVRLRQALVDSGADAEFVESAAGHEWDYWDGAIRQALSWVRRE